METAKKLTIRQKLLLKKIAWFYEEKGYYPAVRDLGRLLGVTSSNTVFSHLAALGRKGYLKKNEKGKIIGLLNTTNVFTAAAQSAAAIPFFPAGAPAGIPTGVEDLPAEILRLDQYLMPKRGQTFALRVRGTSMEKAGIMPDDILLVEKTSQARPGQIILAHLPGGFTVKRLVERRGKLFLQSESHQKVNVKMEEGSQIWGVVSAIIRKY